MVEIQQASRSSMTRVWRMSVVRHFAFLSLGLPPHAPQF
jgi:hypothetical protein